jgi:urocanate hydratase
VVDLLEKLVEMNFPVELGSDQTSLHNPYSGGYYPAGLSFDQANMLMASNPLAFREHVQASLIRHVDAINKLSSRGMYFWDYGNAFLLEAGTCRCRCIFKRRPSGILPMCRILWDRFFLITDSGHSGGFAPLQTR